MGFLLFLISNKKHVNVYKEKVVQNAFLKIWSFSYISFFLFIFFFYVVFFQIWIIFFFQKNFVRSFLSSNLKNGGRSQVVRQWIVTPSLAGSNPVVRP
jgi:hypothetical protein